MRVSMPVSEFLFAMMATMASTVVGIPILLLIAAGLISGGDRSGGR